LAETGEQRRRVQLTAVSSLFSVSLLAVLGCAKTPAPDAADAAPRSICATGYVGDPKLDPLLEVRALQADGTDVPVKDGDNLAVLFPPQGGRVSFVGVRANNVDGCGLVITGALRDPLSKQVRLDGRTVNLQREPDGWGATGHGASANIADSAEIASYSNIPLCPNLWADQNVFDLPFELEVIIVDRLGKKATKTVTVVPRCAEAGERLASCHCLCKTGYVLGEACTDRAADAATE
jgi:hypothetical protein